MWYVFCGTSDLITHLYPSIKGFNVEEKTKPTNYNRKACFLKMRFLEAVTVKCDSL